MFRTSESCKKCITLNLLIYCGLRVILKLDSGHNDGVYAKLYELFLDDSFDYLGYVHFFVIKTKKDYHIPRPTANSL